MMMRAAVVIGLICLVAIPGVCQPPGEGAGPMMPGGPAGDMGMGGMMGPMAGMMGPMMGMMRPQPTPPAPVMMISDGVVYIAFNGKLTAFDAKTLQKIAEATYWEPPQPPMGPPRGPGPPMGPFAPE